MKKLILCALLAINCSLNADIDIILFSYNRPTQLYALLKSAYTYITEFNKIFVVYRSDDAFDDAYAEVEKSFPNVQFLRQTAPYAQSFKPLLMKAFHATKAHYLLFGVDDLIIKDFIHLRKDTRLLDFKGAYGFYYRLGTHLTRCYTLDCEQPVPPHYFLQEGVYFWNFDEGKADWNYPHTVDMALFRKKDIESFFTNHEYSAPNQLEGLWATMPPKNGVGLFYPQSKVVNLPMNVVQTQDKSRHNDFYTAKDLLQKFNKGMQIDLKPFFRLENKSAHDDYKPSFIPRDNNQIFTKFHLDEKHFSHILKTTKEKSYPLYPLPLSTQKFPEKKIVIVTASYNNAQWYKESLDSVFAQDYTNYHIYYVDDMSPDKTGPLALAYAQEKNQMKHFTLIANTERKLALKNIYTTIHENCDDNDIVLMLDGDDFLIGPDVFTYINQVYHQHDIWMTFGNFMRLSEGYPLHWTQPINQSIVANNQFRQYPQVIGHLHTFYAWIFKAIKKQDFLFEGKFYATGWDTAIYTPMAELAGKRHLCIQDPLYLYNDLNSINDHRKDEMKQFKINNHIFKQTPYQPLNEKKSSKPRVSIITSMYKGDDFIEGFLEDIVQQSIFSECELILINANSPGNEEEIIKKYTAQYSNINYIRLDEDPGLYAVWNMGIKMAKADLITNANVDDRRDPNLFENYANFLHKNPEIDLAYSGYFITHYPNETFAKNRYRWATSPAEFSTQAMCKCLPGPHPMWRKSMHKKYGYFSEIFVASADHEMWLRAVSKGSKFKKMPGTTALYYHNPNGISTNQDKENMARITLENDFIVKKYRSVWGG